MSTMADIIAAHVAEYEHDGERGYYECLCAKRWLVESPMGSSDYYRDHAEHVAAELAAAGYGKLADAWDEGAVKCEEAIWKVEILPPNPYRGTVMSEPTPEAVCKECGHPEQHHDAGECWTDSGGNECAGGSVCPCWWYEPETPND
jgi:hypothetical protein